MNSNIVETLPKEYDVIKFIDELDEELISIKEKIKFKQKNSEIFCLNNFEMKLLNDTGMERQLPYRCLETAVLIAAWLIYNGEEEIAINYGYHDDLKDRSEAHWHCWINYSNRIIIDYTHVQFEVLKLQSDQGKYSMTIEELNSKYKIEDVKYIFNISDFMYSNPYPLSISQKWETIIFEMIQKNRKENNRIFKRFAQIYTETIIEYMYYNSCSFSDIFDHRECQKQWQLHYKNI